MARQRSRHPRTTARPAPPATLASAKPHVAAPSPAAAPHRAAPDAAAPHRATPPARPAFWFAFDIGWRKLAALRVALASILAVDAIAAISTAPRYGMGGFNVGHFAWLSSIAPNRTAFVAAQLSIAVAMWAAAFGLFTRAMFAIAAVLYAWTYYASQLDSYQHHYLVSLLLPLCAAVRWEPPARPTDEAQAPASERANPATVPAGGWPLRLMLALLSIMYGWAAIAKLDAAWLNGTTLASQLHGWPGRALAATLGFALTAKLVLVVEVALAATLWHDRTMSIAAGLGIALHAGIAVSGLEIGVFAYLMLALYLAVLPRAWFARFGNRDARAPRAMPTLAHRLRAVSVSALVGGIGLWTSSNLPMRGLFTLGILLLATLALRHYPHRHRAVVAFPLTAALLVVGVDRLGTVSYDYFRYWAGAESRIGDKQKAMALYREVTKRFPNEENGYYQLAKLQLQSGDPQQAEAALTALAKAQALAPHKARAFVLDARERLRRNDRNTARQKIEAALRAEPQHQDAQALAATLQKDSAP